MPRFSYLQILCSDQVLSSLSFLLCVSSLASEFCFSFSVEASFSSSWILDVVDLEGVVLFGVVFTF